ncbi:hypothetical protein IDJ77_00920 [Mucilaginibacter sp. ZT4R22]|uniref:Uncharacterized protein n=1 Tax=Mucilaginibacter pankratovii TaxID=2772110 RepID=A0ABR7WJ81_9SPHI|nr:hypothetical protein [Mucilaginibacter pankratovii]MBD1362356.1 hypothetical protein [Mucilaginibacter pankratovii]
MTRTLYKNALGCFALLVVNINSFGQNANSDTSTRQTQIDNVVAGYYQNIGEQSRLFNGPEHNFYYKTIAGSAYFTEPLDFTIGTVEYDGFVYKNLQMMYDLYKGVVVMQLPSKIAAIELLSDRVQRFDIFGHHFFRMDAVNQVNGPNLIAGFYDQLYDGKTKFIVHREKNIQTNTSAALDNYFTDEARKMYLKMSDGSYKIFSSQKSLLEVLKDKKPELKKFIKDNNVSFRDEKEQAMVKVIAYYDQITN